VNGLTTDKLTDYDFVDKLCSYDVIFLYETWANAQTDIIIDGYKCYNFYRKFQNRRARRCSGGVAVLIRETLCRGISIVVNRHDTIIKLDKHFFGLETYLFLAGVYLWVENSPAYNIVNVDLFDLLQQDIELYQSIGNVFIVGDWNSRVGSKRDYIVCDRYLDFVDYADYMPDIPSVRYTVDAVCNSHGHKIKIIRVSNSFNVCYWVC